MLWASDSEDMDLAKVQIAKLEANNWIQWKYRITALLSGIDGLLDIVEGGFIGSSSLLTGQSMYGKTMLENLNEEQKSFYGKKITALNNYLSAVSAESSFDSLKDEYIIETFMRALNDDQPRELYKVESWRYMIYYNDAAELFH